LASTFALAPVSPMTGTWFTPVHAAGDADLVRQARDGDEVAFADLYRRYARMVHGLLLARVPFDEVDDLVQEVFLSA
jgi:RNA polymerase sigma-70 factor (ECF subfamily)